MFSKHVVFLILPRVKLELTSINTYILIKKKAKEERIEKMLKLTVKRVWVGLGGVFLFDKKLCEPMKIDHFLS